jgi:hypothetical protein
VGRDDPAEADQTARWAHIDELKAKAQSAVDRTEPKTPRVLQLPHAEQHILKDPEIAGPGQRTCGAEAHIDAGYFTPVSHATVRCSRLLGHQGPHYGGQGPVPFSRHRWTVYRWENEEAAK